MKRSGSFASSDMVNHERNEAIFRTIRTQRHPIVAAARIWLQRTYRGHQDAAALKPYLDPAWRALLRADPNAAFWELFLAASLQSVGYQLLRKPRSEGPDLCIQLQDTRHAWIEAVSAEAGDPESNKDHVPEPPSGIASLVPHDKIVLRIVQVLSKKDKAISRYRDAGLIGPIDPIVIAINGWHATHWRSDSNPSYVERACLGVGGLVYEVDRGRGVVGRFLESRPSIQRESGAKRPTTFFADPDNARTHISAVMFATNQICGHTGLSDERLGSELLILHNPRAANPLPDDFPRVGRCLRVVTDQIGQAFVERRDL